jgi:hypothetical protein
MVSSRKCRSVLPCRGPYLEETGPVLSGIRLVLNHLLRRGCLVAQTLFDKFAIHDSDNRGGQPLSPLGRSHLRIRVGLCARFELPA